jgi:Rps23 Pro-64 3,4-dihydroxylase Tpa1-like proline 4-hydroxylase
MDNIVKLKEDIFVIENFITPEEAKSMINYLNWLVNTGILKWNQISFYESYAMGFWEKDDALPMFDLSPTYFNELRDKIKLASEKCFGKELSQITFHAQKWEKGAFASFHSDNSGPDGEPTAFQRSKYAAFLYLNEDFEGGVLNFEHDPITIVPKTGLISIFRGGYKNEHEVTMVKSGERYTIGSFWDEADAVYSDEQKAKWAEELSQTRKEQEEEQKKWLEEKAKGIEKTYVGKNGE